MGQTQTVHNTDVLNPALPFEVVHVDVLTKIIMPINSLDLNVLLPIPKVIGNPILYWYHLQKNKAGNETRIQDLERTSTVFEFLSFIKNANKINYIIAFGQNNSLAILKSLQYFKTLQGITPFTTFGTLLSIFTASAETNLFDVPSNIAEFGLLDSTENLITELHQLRDNLVTYVNSIVLLEDDKSHLLLLSIRYKKEEKEEFSGHASSVILKFNAQKRKLYIMLIDPHAVVTDEVNRLKRRIYSFFRDVLPGDIKVGLLYPNISRGVQTSDPICVHWATLLTATYLLNQPYCKYKEIITGLTLISQEKHIIVPMWMFYMYITHNQLEVRNSDERVKLLGDTYGQNQNIFRKLHKTKEKHDGNTFNIINTNWFCLNMPHVQIQYTPAVENNHTLQTDKQNSVYDIYQCYKTPLAQCDVPCAIKQNKCLLPYLYDKPPKLVNTSSVVSVLQLDHTQTYNTAIIQNDVAQTIYNECLSMKKQWVSVCVIHFEPRVLQGIEVMPEQTFQAYKVLNTKGLEQNINYVFYNTIPLFTTMDKTKLRSTRSLLKTLQEVWILWSFLDERKRIIETIETVITDDDIDALYSDRFTPNSVDHYSGVRACIVVPGINTFGVLNHKREITTLKAPFPVVFKGGEEFNITRINVTSRPLVTFVYKNCVSEMPIHHYFGIHDIDANVINTLNTTLSELLNTDSQIRYRNILLLLHLSAPVTNEFVVAHSPTQCFEHIFYPNAILTATLNTNAPCAYIIKVMPGSKVLSKPDNVYLDVTHKNLLQFVSEKIVNGQRYIYCIYDNSHFDYLQRVSNLNMGVPQNEQLDLSWKGLFKIDDDRPFDHTTMSMLMNNKKRRRDSSSDSDSD